MKSDDDEPDSAGPAHPVFYGFWPRFTVDEEGDEATDAEPTRGIAD